MAHRSPERGRLLADDSVSGAAWCRRHSALVDEWLASLFAGAIGASAVDGLALVAIGGYGRAELCPQSDIDVMLVHARHAGVAAVADRVWYPIWDEGFHLGHSVCTVKEALSLAHDDLDTATALLSARHVAGDASLTTSLADEARAQWQKRAAKVWLPELAERVGARHGGTGEVAFRLEPDLKEGRGGLRDAHALHWADSARPILLEHDAGALAEAYGVLLDARVELQRHTGRSSNVLALPEQDAVAAALGLDADALMARVAEAARVIAWTSDDTWRRLRSSLRGPLGRSARRARGLGDGVQLQDGEVGVDVDADPAADPALVLRAAAAAAANRTVIERHSLERLARQTPPLPDPWPAGARDAFVALLLAGPPAVDVIEALDQRGVWTGILPEWQPVRARPQRNAYHRFTVDRHLLETVANAATLAGRVDRSDLLVIAALLHDLGKGHAGDHTATGVVLARAVCARMGLADADVATVVALVEHHLLLADVATRRDLDDPTTIGRVAAAVGSTERLRLLAALTEADSIATGPTAWGPWKARLVEQLVERVGRALDGAAPEAFLGDPFPTAEQLAQLHADRSRRFDTVGDCLTLMADDQPGLFSRVAGVLALHGLDVLRAAAYSSDDGRALDQFHVVDPVRAEIPWPRVVADLERALTGRLAINARLAERVRTYRRGGPRPSPVAATVHFDNDASVDATVIDVQAPDAIGVLYRITRALAELDLDIRSAKVQTLGPNVVDAFYVRRGRVSRGDGDRDGNGKITDPAHLAEVERAILHGLAADAG